MDDFFYGLLVGTLLGVLFLGVSSSVIMGRNIEAGYFQRGGVAYKITKVVL